VVTSDPGAYFREVAVRRPRCFWLDGGGARQWSGRRSVVGWLEADDVSLSWSATTREVTRHAGGRAEVVGDDVFAVLEAELAAGAPGDQWFGYLGYAARPDLPGRPDPDLPDAVWMRPSHVRLFEHPAGVGRGSDQASGGHEPQPWAAQPDPAAPVPADYAAAYDRVQEHLHAGNSYEVNLTHRIEVAADLDPVVAYLRLRALNPAPYAGFLQHDVPGARAWLLSSSPERYATIGADRTIETRPIKGTTPRDPDPARDADLRARLAGEPRFRSENLMIVDLLRNDLSMVCTPGTVEVPDLMRVESYPSVHQLVSTVRGRLRDGVTAVAALRALFPAGSMTGAPKLRTMAIIDEVEATPRGVYAGAFGWLAADGRADLGVVIRSLTTAGDGRWRLGTGGGITVLSDVEGEHAESRWKAERLLRVLDRA
jgi:para-aminobenzoate synthetase